jgi:hypothetical protein
VRRFYTLMSRRLSRSRGSTMKRNRRTIHYVAVADVLPAIGVDPKM